jgi:hypothetical protein
MVDKSDILSLYQQHAASQDKYAYFLLAAAGAAIGFAVQKTDGLLLSCSLWPVGAAVLCWGVSFYAGCKRITWVQTSISANYTRLQLQHGSHAEQPPHPELVEAAIRGVTTAFNKNLSWASFYSRLQFYTLISGAVFFIGWRLMVMAGAAHAV